MKREEITTEFIQGVKKIVEQTAKHIIVFCDIEFVEHKYFDVTGKDSNYLIFALTNCKYGCSQSATYDCEHEAIDFNLHRVAVIKNPTK